MQRLASFDYINKPRLDILNCLNERELDLGEIARTLKVKRNVTYYHLKLLVKFGLVSQKKSLKQNIFSGKRSHREVIHYLLASDGREAVKFYSFERRD